MLYESLSKIYLFEYYFFFLVWLILTSLRINNNYLLKYHDILSDYYYGKENGIESSVCFLLFLFLFCNIDAGYPIH